jgi:signal transduction histidine kinase
LKLSLRWRIATAYAVLLVCVLAASSAVIVWRFQAILYDQAQARIDTTMHEIVLATQPSNPFDVSDATSEPLAPLLNSNNLAAWQSATTFVQVDSVSGYPLARTPNLGGARLSPNLTLTQQKLAEFRTIDLAGHSFLVEDRLFRGASFGAVVHVAEPLDALNRTFARAWEGIALIILIAAIGFVGLAIALASQISGPIVALSHAMRTIGSDRLDSRLPQPKRNDEIAELTRSFNDLLARLEEAFARERQFISDASHELKTPLTSINANAQMLLRWGDREEAIRRESIETIERESATLAAMVNGMLTLAKADRGDDIPKEPVSLSHLAQEVARASASRVSEAGLTLACVPGNAETIVFGDANLLRQLIANLVDNALKFTHKGGVRITLGSDADNAWVDIADSGPGIPEAELAHVFERFYRADRARSRDVPGTGLGLAIVRSIARVHGGTVTASRAPEGGALFRATFPRLEADLTGSS